MTYYSERLLKEKFPQIASQLTSLPGRPLHDIRIEAANDFIDLLKDKYMNDLYDVAGPSYDGRFVHEDELREAIKEFIKEQYDQYV